MNDECCLLNCCHMHLEDDTSNGTHSAIEGSKAIVQTEHIAHPCGTHRDVTKLGYYESIEILLYLHMYIKCNFLPQMWYIRGVYIALTESCNV